MIGSEEILMILSSQYIRGHLEFLKNFLTKEVSDSLMPNCLRLLVLCSFCDTRQQPAVCLQPIVALTILQSQCQCYLEIHLELALHSCFHLSKSNILKGIVRAHLIQLNASWMPVWPSGTLRWHFWTLQGLLYSILDLLECKIECGVSWCPTLI